MITLGRRQRHGFVYLLRGPDGAWKIGRTKNPANRLRTFKVKLPFPVQYEHLIVAGDMYALETRLHNQFARNRVNGEWFELSDEDVEYIKSINNVPALKPVEDMGF